MLKLKLQYFSCLMWRANSLEKILMLGKTESKRRRRQQRMRWLDSITSSTDINLSKLWEIVEDRRVWHAAVHGLQRVGHNLGTEKQQSKTVSTVWSPLFYRPSYCHCMPSNSAIWWSYFLQNSFCFIVWVFLFLTVNFVVAGFTSFLATVEFESIFTSKTAICKQFLLCGLVSFLR